MAHHCFSISLVSSLILTRGPLGFVWTLVVRGWLSIKSAFCSVTDGEIPLSMLRTAQRKPCQPKWTHFANNQPFLLLEMAGYWPMWHCVCIYSTSAKMAASEQRPDSFLKCDFRVNLGWLTNRTTRYNTLVDSMGVIDDPGCEKVKYVHSASLWAKRGHIKPVRRTFEIASPVAIFNFLMLILTTRALRVRLVLINCFRRV